MKEYLYKAGLGDIIEFPIEFPIGIPTFWKDSSKITLLSLLRGDVIWIYRINDKLEKFRIY